MTTNGKSISDHCYRYPEARLFWFGKQIVVPQGALMGSWSTLASMIEWTRRLSYGWQNATCIGLSLSIEDACKIPAILDNNRTLSAKFRSADFWPLGNLKPPLSSSSSSLRWVLLRIYGEAHSAEFMPILLTAISECRSFDDVWERFEQLAEVALSAASNDVQGR
jgi:hypothetical protein